MSTIDWLRETAAFMHKDRPDVYATHGEAVDELTNAMERLRYVDLPVSSMMFTSYVLTRILDDGMEEFLLSRKLSTLCIFVEDEETTAISHDPRIDLPDVWESLDEDY